jgi:hypothetical protein
MDASDDEVATLHGTELLQTCLRRAHFFACHVSVELDVLSDILSSAEAAARVKKANRISLAASQGTTTAELDASVSDSVAPVPPVGSTSPNRSKSAAHPLTLLSLLAVYEPVLRKHGISAADDVRFHQLLLRLQSQDPDTNWWMKLTNERHVSVCTATIDHYHARDVLIHAF